MRAHVGGCRIAAIKPTWKAVGLAFARKLEVSYTGVATPHLHIRVLPPPWKLDHPCHPVVSLSNPSEL